MGHLDWYDILGLFGAAFLLSFILVPLSGRLAHRVSGIDRCEARKIHCTDTPRLGGIAIFAASLAPLLIILPCDRSTLALFAGAMLALLVGIIDDLCTLSPAPKFMGQLLAATVGVMGMGGDRFTLKALQITDQTVGGRWSVIITIIAVVGIMNAINFLDGLDALAGGVSTVVLFGISLLALHSANDWVLVIVVSLTGGVVGFLRYNWHPAKVFMGDSGSLLLGYLMAMLSCTVVSGSNGAISPILFLVMLGVPVVDALVVTVRRLLQGGRFWRADTMHIHHQLLRCGFSHEEVTLILVGITILLVMFVMGNRYQASAPMLSFVLVIFVFGYLVLQHMVTSRAIQTTSYHHTLPINDSSFLYSHGIGEKLIDIVIFVSLLTAFC
jgi:UDP-GlcNAc:undecaprenyl-phosphate GlcNAc-1-phosphate transferase